MTRSRDPLNYEDFWFQLIRDVMNGKVVELPIADLKQRKKIHLDWSSFKGALKNDPGFEQQSRQARQIRCSLADGKVTWYHTNNSDIARALGSVLSPLDAPAIEPVPEAAPAITATDFVADDSDTIILMSKYMQGKGS